MERPVPTRNWLLIAAVAFLAANLLHGFDHLRTGPDRLTAEVRTGGALVTIAAIGAVWLVVKRAGPAPMVAAIVGLWSAALIASAHFAPHWSAFSDSYWDLSADWFSWLVAGAEVAAALALGVAGLWALRARRTPTRTGPPSGGPVDAAGVSG